MGNRKILAVEDLPFLLKNLAFILEKAGYEACTASDGEEALEKARRRSRLSSS